MDTQTLETAGEAKAARGGRLAAATGGVSALPLAVLFGLNFVDEFDRLAFETLVSEIRDAFAISEASVIGIIVVGSALSLIAALPIGWLGDRFNRVRIAAVSAVVWAVMSVATGLAGALALSVWLLLLIRLLANIGRISNEVIHPSLLSDYYPMRSHPSVFRVHRFANPASAVGGLAAGYIAKLIGWEWAFYLLALPSFALILATLALREPLRGESIDKGLAEEIAAKEGPTPFAEARRQLFAVRTLKRLWLGAFFLGVGWIPLGGIMSFFFDNVYGFGPAGRGWITFLRNAGIAAGLLIGGWLASRVVREGRLQHLATITALSFLAFAVGLVVMAASPWVSVSVAFAFLLSLGIGSFQPAYFSLVGQVSPPKVRSQAYAYAVLILGAGGMLGFVIGGIGETRGYRVAVIVLAALVAFASLIGVTASRFVLRDIDQAARTLETAVRLHHELAESGSRALLVCKGVEVAYDQVQVLFGVDMEIEEGEIVALLGTNGAGKSTLLKAISGLVDPVGGAIFFDGRDITHADAVQSAKLGIVQVPGGKAVFPTLTVADHFKAASWLYAKSPEAVQRGTEEVLEMFPRLGERWTQMAGNMSGGEQQMLALGMAFIAKPRLLMIDELSLGLAPTVVEQLLNIVRAIHAQGATIILVEQSVNVALTVASRAYFMEKGEVRFSGPTEELLERGDILRSVFLEGAGSVGGKGKRKRAKATTEVREPDPGETAEMQSLNGDRPVVLEVRGLTKRFGGITAVDEVDIVLHHNEILGLIGPNGAGKTTIFDLISGHLQQDHGRLYLAGTDVTEMAADQRAALGLGRSFQDARIFPALTVAENIALGLERHIEVRDHLASLLDLPAVQESEQDVAWTVDDLIELMGLGAFRDKFVSELSTGTRRIVDLAMSIAHDPVVLLLDEPSSGIAQRETEALGPLLRRIQSETDCALLVIEHDMPLITEVSDEIVALELGRVILRDTPGRVLSHPRVIESYLGGDLDVIHRSGSSKTMEAKRTGRRSG
ncbi:MAG TPA: MFS transporter [Actinomycetota bacterium]|nr:MFS transporter [Actinomycetota bacterium]